VDRFCLWSAFYGNYSFYKCIEIGITKMVKHLKVISPVRINEELKTVELWIEYGALFRNSNQECEYFLRKFNKEDIKKIAKSYFKFSEFELRKFLYGLGSGKIIFKFWDIELINNKMNDLILEVQNYVNKI